MDDDAYPLEHWSAWSQAVPQPVVQAVAWVIQLEELPDRQELEGGVMTLPLAGAIAYVSAPY